MEQPLVHSNSQQKTSRYVDFNDCQFNWLLAACQQFVTNLSILSNCNKSVKIRAVKTIDLTLLTYTCG